MGGIKINVGRRRRHLNFSIRNDSKNVFQAKFEELGNIAFRWKLTMGSVFFDATLKMRVRFKG